MNYELCIFMTGAYIRIKRSSVPGCRLVRPRVERRQEALGRTRSSTREWWWRHAAGWCCAVSASNTSPSSGLCSRLHARMQWRQSVFVSFSKYRISSNRSPGLY